MRYPGGRAKTADVRELPGVLLKREEVSGMTQEAGREWQDRRMGEQDRRKQSGDVKEAAEEQPCGDVKKAAEEQPCRDVKKAAEEQPCRDVKKAAEEQPCRDVKKVTVEQSCEDVTKVERKRQQQQGKTGAQGENGGILYLVIPCYQEEEVIEDTARELEQAMKAMIKDGLIREESRIVFVDDGSRDHTWQLIRRQTDRSPLFGAVRLQFNTGHQNALYAGLMEVKDRCHMAVSMDADLQDDPALLPAMVRRYYEGNEIVYAVRNRREGEGVWKRASAFCFYRFMGAMGADIPRDCGDFRLMGREALEALSQFGEHRPFLRGLVPGLGFPSAAVSFDRRPRKRGKSKYSLRHMIRFAMDGLVSLSARPVHMIMILGLALFLGAGLWTLCHLGKGPGWATVIGSIWSAAGLVLFSVGMIGQYIVRIWQEQTGRPRYLVAERISMPLNDGK